MRSVFAVIVLLCGVACSARAMDVAPVLMPGEVAGHVVFGAEVFTFTPCGTEEPLWLDGPRHVTDLLKKRQSELTDEIYEPYFAILEGSVGPLLDCGFCEDYEGSFGVRGVILTRQAGEEDCASFQEGP